MNEIDKDFYCSANCYDFTECYRYPSMETIYCRHENKGCACYHRKHPTPEQFKEEYGKEYPDDGAVYVLIKSLKGSGYWNIDGYGRYLAEMGGVIENLIVCACTPYGKPDDNWRPK